MEAVTQDGGVRPWPVILRFALVAAAVVLCYCFPWDFLRYLTCELNLRLDALFGVHLQRVSFDTVLWQGTLYRYVIACTFADVWCGALPLLWDLRRSILANLRRIVLFSVALLALNILRLSLSDVLFAARIPWSLAHDVVGGAAYALVWAYLWQTRSWGIPARHASFAASAPRESALAEPVTPS